MLAVMLVFNLSGAAFAVEANDPATVVVGCADGTQAALTATSDPQS